VPRRVAPASVWREIRHFAILQVLKVNLQDSGDGGGRYPHFYVKACCNFHHHLGYKRDCKKTTGFDDEEKKGKPRCTLHLLMLLLMLSLDRCNLLHHSSPKV
jgi:hypothetical protein